MAVSIKKTIVGTVISLGVIGIGVPIAYWYVIQALDRAVGWGALLEGPASLILAASSFLIGVFWVLWAYSYLVFIGEGLPTEAFGVALHPTRVLVTTGPYAYTRNPMILGVLFILLGVALLQGSAFGLILLLPIAVVVSVHLVVFEERGLLHRFGADFEEYRRNVPILVPRVKAYYHEPVTGKQA